MLTAAFALLTAHLLADFPFQTDRVAAKKLDNPLIRGQHAITHATLALIFLIPIPKYTHTQVITGFIIIGVTHFIIDSKRWGHPIDRKSHDEFWLALATDQAYHVAAIYYAALAMTLM